MYEEQTGRGRRWQWGVGVCGVVVVIWGRGGSPYSALPLRCLHMGSSEGKLRGSTSVHMCKELPRGRVHGNATGSIACSVSFTAVVSAHKLRPYCQRYAQTAEGQLCSTSPRLNRSIKLNIFECIFYFNLSSKYLWKTVSDYFQGHFEEHLTSTNSHFLFPFLKFSFIFDLCGD